MRINEIVDNSVKLYRGVSNHTEQKFKGIVRQDRQPRDSKPSHVRNFNLYMDFKSWPFRKNNTLSTSIEFDQAKFYTKALNKVGLGTVYQIIPDPPAQFLYSTELEDMLDMSLILEADLIKVFGHHSKVLAASDEEIKEAFQTILQKANPKRYNHLHMVDDISKINNAEGEVLVYCKTYTAIKTDYQLS